MGLLLPFPWSAALQCKSPWIPCHLALPSPTWSNVLWLIQSDLMASTGASPGEAEGTHFLVAHECFKEWLGKRLGAHPFPFLLNKLSQKLAPSCKCSAPSSPAKSPSACAEPWRCEQLQQLVVLFLHIPGSKLLGIPAEFPFAASPPGYSLLSSRNYGQSPVNRDHCSGKRAFWLCLFSHCVSAEIRTRRDFNQRCICSDQAYEIA